MDVDFDWNERLYYQGEYNPLHGTPSGPHGKPWDSTPAPLGWVPVVGERVTVRHRPQSQLPLGCDWLHDWFGQELWVGSVRYERGARGLLNVGVHDQWPPHREYGETDGFAVEDLRPLGSDSAVVPPRKNFWRYVKDWWGA